MYTYHQCKLQNSNESVFALKIQQGVPSGKILQNNQLLDQKAMRIPNFPLNERISLALYVPILILF